MTAKLTVILHIVLSLIVGVVLIFAPWWQPFGLGEWGDNYFLLYVARLTGSEFLQRAVASGWVRGAVTGLGLLNVLLAFSDLIRFRRAVASVEEAEASGAPARSLPATPESAEAPDASFHSPTRNAAASTRQDEQPAHLTPPILTAGDRTPDDAPSAAPAVNLPHHEQSARP